MVLVLLKQVALMFVLAGVGLVMFRTGKISSEGSKSLGNIMIYLSLPCTIINGFLIERTPEHTQGLLLSALAALLLLLLSMLFSSLFFKNDATARFGAAFANPGFFGVPIIVALQGSGAVFYVAFFIAFLNLLQWSWGVGILVAEGKNEKVSPLSLLTPKKIFTAPFMIAILIGLVLYGTQVTLPSIISGAISSIAALNTPLAMFAVGIYLAQTDIAAMFRKKKLYAVSAVKLVLIPLAAILILKFLFPSAPADMKLAVLISCACPVGSNVAVYAQLYDRNYTWAVEMVVISTILSIATLPVMVSLANMAFL